MRTVRKQAKFRVRPTNIRNGQTAPYFIIEPDSKAKREEIQALADETFKKSSALAKFSNWHPEVEKI